jgi:hypothetical protein
LGAAIRNSIVIGAILVLLASPVQSSAAEPEWSRRPYRIQAILAVEGPGEIAAQIAAAMPAYLAERAEAAVGPLWELDAQAAGGALRQRILTDLDALADDPAAEFSFAADKLVLLAVRATAEGYDLAGREFDGYTQRWGATVTRSTRQSDAICEQLFALLHRVVSPLAQLDADPQAAGKINILLRGADLPQMAGDARGIRTGDVFLPLLRRTSRTGEMLPKGIVVLPWTFVETTAVKDDGAVVGRIHTGTRQSLAGRADVSSSLARRFAAIRVKPSCISFRGRNQAGRWPVIRSKRKTLEKRRRRPWA